MAHSEDSNRPLTDDELTDLWKESFRVSLPVESGKKMRLKELETWDIPNGSPSNNPYPWRTHACKIKALKELLNYYKNH